MPIDSPFDWTVRKFQVPDLGEREGYMAMNATTEVGKEIYWRSSAPRGYYERTWQVVYMLAGFKVWQEALSATGDHPGVPHDETCSFNPITRVGTPTKLPNVDVHVLGACVRRNVGTPELLTVDGISPQ